ncbi:hypothetical protein MKX01_010617 [Papaver californicum]|nr:hypothetical protein MKX01_010617 [Papaver californicum]
MTKLPFSDRTQIPKKSHFWLSPLSPSLSLLEKKKENLILRWKQNNSFHFSCNKKHILGVAEDRISELPESLIHHILSFLPIKCIASTTILSKRWNNLWLSLPILDFTQWRSPPPPPTAATYENRNEEESVSDTDGSESADSELVEYRVIKDSPPVDLSETNKIMDFLDKVLFFDKLAHAKKFFLKTESMYFDQDRVKKWINLMVRRDVEELICSIKFSGPRVVPSELFYFLDQSPLSLISFKRVKKLRLLFIEFKDKTLAMQVFSSFPGLEDLYMSSVIWKGLDFFTIRGFGRGCIENVKVKFDTPNLLSLMWFDHLLEKFVVDSFPCYTKNRYDSLYKFVEKVSHVKHLMVSHTYFRPKVLLLPSVVFLCCPCRNPTKIVILDLLVVGTLIVGDISKQYRMM